jgi:adenine deaminase
VKVAQDGVSLIASVPFMPTNNSNATEIGMADIALEDSGLVPVIVAHDGDLITSEEEHYLIIDEAVLKLVVVNRYEDGSACCCLR